MDNLLKCHIYAIAGGVGADGECRDPSARKVREPQDDKA
jgi:hypothetical protein